MCAAYTVAVVPVKASRNPAMTLNNSGKNEVHDVPAALGESFSENYDYWTPVAFNFAY